MKVKDSSIELLRVIAGVLVLSAHLIGTYIIYNSKFSPVLLLGDVITRSSVPAFFMITGYFMDSGKSVIRQYKSFLKRVLMPTFLTVVICGICIPILTEIVLKTNEEIPSFTQAIWMILSGEIDQFQHCFHLWYIVELSKCYLFLPVIQMLCSTEEYITRIRRFILVVGFYAGVLIPSINTISGGLEKLPFSYMPITIYAWYILLGYEIGILVKIYNRPQKGRVVGGMLFIIGAIGLFASAYFGDYLLNNRITNIYFSNYYFFVVIESIGLFLVCIFTKIRHSKSEKIIICVGSTVFGVYLIHPIVYSVIWHLNIEKLISVLGLEGFMVVFIFLTFVCSVCIILLLQNTIKRAQSAKVWLLKKKL